MFENLGVGGGPLKKTTCRCLVDAHFNEMRKRSLLQSSLPARTPDDSHVHRLDTIFTITSPRHGSIPLQCFCTTVRASVTTISALLSPLVTSATSPHSHICIYAPVLKPLLHQAHLQTGVPGAEAPQQPPASHRRRALPNTAQDGGSGALKIEES